MTAPAAPGPAPVPAVIDGWRIEAHIGSGGWSQVFMARGVLDGVPRRLALKIVPADAPSQVGEAVVREAHALSAFAHPNLIRALGAWQTPASGELAGAVVFLLPAAELSLAEHLRDLAAAGGEPDDLRAVCAAAAGVASAVAYLHRAHKPDGSGPVMHNDIKPENILQIAGRWQLSDLGLASPPGRAGLAAHAGSQSYLAPEYLSDPPAERHPPGDVWALGVVLHRWLTAGEFPFPGASSAERAQAVLDGAAPQLQIAEPAIRALVAAMLARRPQDRPSARAVARALRRAGGVRPPMPRAKLAAAAAAGLLLVAGFAGGAIAEPFQHASTVNRYASYGTAKPLHPDQKVPVLARPRLDARVVGRLSAGDPAGIICTKHGSLVHGYWGATTLWDRISFGRSAGWVSDGFLYTGTNNAVAPRC